MGIRTEPIHIEVIEMDEENRIKELEKQVEELSYIHGICDKFGTYQSLKKDADIILFFLSNPEKKRRYIEVIDNFTGWGRSTIETHLRNLTRRGILEKTHLPGEYELAQDMSRDMDTLVYYLVGDSLYRLARKSWEKKEYLY
jgi:hypothetical protein